MQTVTYKLVPGSAEGKVGQWKVVPGKDGKPVAGQEAVKDKQEVWIYSGPADAKGQNAKQGFFRIDKAPVKVETISRDKSADLEKRLEMLAKELELLRRELKEGRSQGKPDSK